MDELLVYLNQFYDLIQKQKNLFIELIDLLNQEEDAISRCHFVDIEKSVILKDQLLQRLKNMEEQRQVCTQKLFYLMAFDSRNQKPSLTLFKQVFQTYQKNVQPLVGESISQQLAEFNSKFMILSLEYEELFKNFSGRLYRNKIIVKKMLHNIRLSSSLFQTESILDTNYDSLGKACHRLTPQNKTSSVRVKV